MDIELQSIIDTINTPKKNLIVSFVLGVFIFGFIFGSVGFLRAQEGTIKQRKEELRSKMERLQTDINEYREQINEVQKKEASLEEELSMYENKIEKLKLQIERLNLSIKNTNEELKKQKNRLEEIKEGIKVEKKLLRTYIEETRRYDEVSTISLVFGDNDLSSFFDRMREVSKFRGAIMEGLEKIQEERKVLAEEKEKLDAKRAELYDMKNLQEIQKRTLAQQKKNKKKLLAKTRENKKTFLSITEEKKNKLEQVKKELFELEDLGVSMKLKEAIDEAKFVSKKTGVRSALLLAILEHESELGENLGSGDYRHDMHPDHHEAFLNICAKNNLDPNETPVSPQPSYSWCNSLWECSGGAMGPAQFMPNTWQGYEKQIEKLTGDSPVSPYNFEHALMALGVKLQNAEADSGSYQDEFDAVMSYFSGGDWTWSEERAYGDPVMKELVPKYQRKIDILEQQNS